MALIINGETIEDAAIQREVELLRPHYEEVFADQAPAEREAQLLEWSRENVVERVLLRQEVKKNSNEMPPAEVESVLTRLKDQYEDPQELYRDHDVQSEAGLRETIELQMRVERKLNEVRKNSPKPSEADIKQFYEENKEQFKSDEQIRVAHIVKYVDWRTDEAAAFEVIKKAHNELKSGAAFETVVDKYTDCADSGGDLGQVTRGQLVEEFEDVVFNLGTGQVSDIFRTRFGFHIAKVYGRRPGVTPSLKEAKQRVVDELRKQMRDKAIDDFIDQLKSKADIQEV